MKKIIYKIITFLTMGLVFSPAIITFAEVTTFAELVDQVFISGIIRPIAPFLVGLAVVVFIYGVILFMFSAGGEKKEEAKQYMFWGIVGIFVMVSIWGLVAILQGTFQLQNNPQSLQLTVPNVTIITQ